VKLNARPGFVAVAVAAAAAATGAAVVVRGFEIGVITLQGVRLVAFLVGAVVFGAGVFLFQRGVKRRARIDAMAALLPRYRRNRNPDPFLLDDGYADDEPLDGMPVIRSEMRAATRALLVSLEEEMRCESGPRRRPVRPACRRARLRVAGRSEPGRRRISVRPASIPS
jgi:hypothetical protein